MSKAVGLCEGFKLLGRVLRSIVSYDNIKHTVHSKDAAYRICCSFGVQSLERTDFYPTKVEVYHQQVRFSSVLKEVGAHSFPCLVRKGGSHEWLSYFRQLFPAGLAVPDHVLYGQDQARPPHTLLSTCSALGHPQVPVMDLVQHIHSEVHWYHQPVVMQQ